MDDFPADRYLRAARRRADLSQRELADRAGMHRSAVSRVEQEPRLARAAPLAQLLACAGFRLIVVDDEGIELAPEPLASANVRDRSYRRFPAHLDVRPASQGWWGAMWPMFDGRQPIYTFDRSRSFRDWRRRNEESTGVAEVSDSGTADGGGS